MPKTVATNRDIDRLTIHLLTKTTHPRINENPQTPDLCDFAASGLAPHKMQSTSATKISAAGLL